MAEVNESSILDDVKKVLMIGPTDTSFDVDIIMGINTAISSLHDLGVGPSPAIEISDKTTKWSALFGSDTSMAQAKTYVSLMVKDDFDPTGTAHVRNARKARIDELGSKLMYKHDKTMPKRSSSTDPIAGLGG